MSLEEVATEVKELLFAADQKDVQQATRSIMEIISNFDKNEAAKEQANRDAKLEQEKLRLKNLPELSTLTSNSGLAQDEDEDMVTIELTGTGEVKSLLHTPDFQKILLCTRDGNKYVPWARCAEYLKEVHSGTHKLVNAVKEKKSMGVSYLQDLCSSSAIRNHAVSMAQFEDQVQAGLKKYFLNQAGANHFHGLSEKTTIYPMNVLAKLDNVCEEKLKP